MANRFAQFVEQPRVNRFAQFITPAPEPAPASPRPTSVRPGPGWMEERFGEGHITSVPEPEPVETSAARDPALREFRLDAPQDDQRGRTFPKPDPFRGEGFGDLAARRGQEVGLGAAEMVSSAIRGAAAMQADMERGSSREGLERRIAEAPRPEDRMRLEQWRQTLEESGLAYDEADRTPAEALPLYGSAARFDQWARDTIGVPPEDDSFWSKFAGGAGSFAAFFATSIPSAALGPAGIAATGATFGSLANSGQIYQEAIEAGATEDQALDAAGVARVLGATEVVPILNILRPLERAMPGISNRAIAVLGKALRNATEEGLQEGLVEIGNNLIAAGHYDPERGWSEGVTESVIIGAMLGGGVGGAVGTGQAIRGRREPPAGPAGPSRDPRDYPPAPTQRQIDAAEDARLYEEGERVGQQIDEAQARGAPLAEIRALQDDLGRITRQRGLHQSPIPTPLLERGTEIMDAAERGETLPLGVPAGAVPAEVLIGAPEAAPPTPPARPQRPEQATDEAILLGAGHDAERIRDMSPQERAAEVEIAREQGVTPVVPDEAQRRMVEAPPHPVSAPGTAVEPAPLSTPVPEAQRQQATQSAASEAPVRPTNRFAQFVTLEPEAQRPTGAAQPASSVEPSAPEASPRPAALSVSSEADWIAMPVEQRAEALRAVGADADLLAARRWALVPMSVRNRMTTAAALPEGYSLSIDGDGSLHVLGPGGFDRLVAGDFGGNSVDDQARLLRGAQRQAERHAGQAAPVATATPAPAATNRFARFVEPAPHTPGVITGASDWEALTAEERGAALSAVGANPKYARNGWKGVPISVRSQLAASSEPAGTPAATRLQRRPFTNRLKALGIDPQSPVAAELRQVGIDARSTPGLFRAGGLKDVDNLPASEWADLAHQIGVDGQYLSRQGVIDALVRERAGDPVQDSAQMAAQAAADARAERDRLEARARAEVREELREYGIDVTAAEEAGIIEAVLAGDSVPSAIERFLIRDAERDRPADVQHDPIPSWDDAGAPAEAGPAVTGGDGRDRGPVQGEPVGAERDRGAEGRRAPRAAESAPAAEDGRGQDRQRTATEEGGRVYLTAEGRQAVITGAERITDRELAARRMEQPKRGGDAALPEGSLFDEVARNQEDMFGRPSGRSTAGPQSTEKRKNISPKARREAQDKARAEYFTPGNIVRAYGGGHDRVVTYSPPDADGRWSVEVQSVVRDGDGWKPNPDDSRIRRHMTEPGARDLASGPIERAAPDRSREARQRPEHGSGRRLDEATVSAIVDDLKRQLRDFNLPGLKIEVADRLFARGANGRFVEVDGLFDPDRGLIAVSLAGSRDINTVLGHEAIHALRNAGLFRGPEWRALERAARADTTAMDRARREYPELTEEQIVEEVIADMFGDWRAGDMEAKGFLRTAMERIIGILDAIGNALRGNSFTTAEAVFRAVERGELGRREGGARGDGRTRTAKARTPSDSSFAADVLTALAEVDDLFAFPKSPARTLGGVFRDIDPTITFVGDMGQEMAGEKGADQKFLLRTGAEKPSDFFVYQTDGQVWIDVSELKPGEAGSAVYAAVADYAANTGRVFIGDPAGLSDIALRRRTDAMLSSAFKHGSTKHLEPHARQHEGDPSLGIPPLEWHSGDTLANMEALIEVSTTNLLNAIPELANARYDFATRTFRRSSGERLDDATLREWSAQHERVREAGAGGRTLKRGILLNSLLRAESGKRPGILELALRQPGKLVADAKGVLYAKTHDITDPGESPQITLVGALNLQPLDRAIRAPFDFLGGTDEFGRWRPGVALDARMQKLITESKFRDDGVMGFMNPILEKARAGLIDRYGLDEAYVELDRQRGLDERRIMAQVPEMMAIMRDRSVGAQEAKVLHAVLTGETVADADMKALAEPIRQAIDDLGAEAVALGLLSPETYERNRGSYLHRVYAKHETDQGALARWASERVNNGRKKIIGNQLKGRGLFEKVDVDRLMRHVPGFAEGLVGRPVNGDKFVILDRIDAADQGTLAEIDPQRPKVRERAFVPADQPIPAAFRGWTNRGTWEVRGEGKDYVLWRDFTKAERMQMGEILDARYTIAKTFTVMAKDLATGRFFKGIAENAEWTRAAEPPHGTWADAEEYNKRFWANPDMHWVKVPDTTVPRSTAKRYGALAGRYVRAEIWRDLNELDRMMTPRWWESLLTQWKLNKTARSPVVHMNNVMSNFVLMDMADIRTGDFVRGVREYARGGRMYEEALSNRAFGADMISQEIRENVLKPILKEIASEAASSGARTHWLNSVGIVGKVLEGIYDRGRNLDRKMVDLYRVEDEVFRMATYIRRREQGATAKQAAIEARDQFLNYDIRAPWVNAARRSVLPFLSYTYRAVPRVAQTMMHRPWKMAKYALVAQMANALAYELAPSGDDEERERRSFRDQEQGFTWIGTPRMMRMPWLDNHGNPVFLDIRRWIPAGDVFDLAQGQSVVPVPAWLQFGGPLMIGAELMLNRAAFTGEDIYDPLTDDARDRFLGASDFLWKSWMPSAAWVPNSWYWQRIGNAWRGATDAQGREYSLPQAVASSVGIKLRGQDVRQAMRWKAVDFDREQGRLRLRRSQIVYRRERNLISYAGFEREIGRIDAKLEVLKLRRRDALR